MSPTNDSPDEKMEEVSDRLEEGLRTCRSVLNDYRQLLSNNSNEFDEGQGIDRDS